MRNIIENNARLKISWQERAADAFAFVTAILTILFIYVVGSDRLRHQADAAPHPVLMAKTTLRAR